LSDKALSQFITCRIVILKKKIGYTPVLEWYAGFEFMDVHP
jgi:hypothetical protein